jgi:hypothetical protein
MPHLKDSHFPTKEIEVGSIPTWGATYENYRLTDGQVVSSLLVEQCFRE